MIDPTTHGLPYWDPDAGRILVFDGPTRWASNFSEDWVVDQFGVPWPTSEHLYQALKHLDHTYREAIRKAERPGQAKRMGRARPQRAGFEDYKVDVMLHCLELKFRIDSTLARLLCDSYPSYMEEGNTWHDTLWGVCVGGCKKVGPHQKLGRNFLGHCLMRRRAVLLDIAAA